MNTEELETLFIDWVNDPMHSGSVFFKDGIVDYEKWKDESFKILFLAKEAYTDEERNLDLREIIRDEAPFSKWQVVAQWIYAIKELKKNPEIIPVFPSELEWENSNDLLRSIAFVNTKKSKGASMSYEEDIIAYAMHDKDRLSKQIDLINPHLVLCNYTFYWSYKRIYPEDTITNYNESEYVYIHNRNGVDRIVIDFWHFANRSPSVINFYALCAIIHQSVIFKR